MAKVEDFTYLENLYLVRRREGNGNRFILSRPYQVYFKLDGQDIYYTVNKGYRTDLASIPKIVPKWIAQKVDKHIEAAVVHDHICSHRPYTSDIAAKVFKKAMEVAGVPAWRRELMYRAVKYFGPQW